MKKGKLLTSIAAAALSLTMLAGCNGSGTTETGDLQMKMEPGEGTKVTAEELDLTIFLHRGGLGAFDYDKMTMFQEAFRETNIKLSGTASASNTDAQQEFNIMLTNSPLPDIIQGTKTNLNSAAIEGALIPLEDLVKEYAPNIQAVFDEHPEYVAGSVASDGHLYYIPSLFEGKPSVGFYIRQDWLDKLGLEVPTTLDEYYNVLKAFREQDPNGNGLKDEVPYFYRDSGVDGLIQLWDAYNTWHVNDEGQVVHGKTEEEYKNAMKALAQWYQEGLIDQEIYSRGSQAREQLLGENLGGSTHDWFSSTGSFNRFADTIEGFNWVAIAPPADVNGVVKEIFARQELVASGWGISSDNQYPVETIKYFDWWFSENGRRTYAYGIEGVDYVMVDGKPQYTEETLNKEGGVPMYMRDMGQLEFGAPMSIQAEIDAMTPQAQQGFELYNDHPEWYTEQFPALSYTTEEERIIQDQGTAVDTLITETQQEWLMGTKDVDATWDQYLADLDSMGYQQVRQAQQDAYDRYQESLAAIEE